MLWQNLSKTTFFGNLGWYAAATLRKGVRDGHGDYASWTQTPPLLRVNHHVWSAFCPPRGIALVRGRLAGLQPALGGEERRVGPSILPSSRLPTLPKPHKSATARPPPSAKTRLLICPPPVPRSAELSHSILTSLGFSFFLLGPLGSSRGGCRPPGLPRLFPGHRPPT